MFLRTFEGFVTTSNPYTDALPEVGLSKVVRIIIVVLFPAPLGPRKPKISPSSTFREMLSIATDFLKFFVNELISIALMNRFLIYNIICLRKFLCDR